MQGVRVVKERKLLVPSYMQQFSCIGSSCEDSCCVGWQVNIDHESFKKYAKIQDKELKSIIKDHVKKHNSRQSHENFAKIKMLPNNQCAFLSEEKMCKLQLKYGEKY